jgi:hypothetical protein
MKISAADRVLQKTENNEQIYLKFIIANVIIFQKFGIKVPPTSVGRVKIFLRIF